MRFLMGFASLKPPTVKAMGDIWAVLSDCMYVKMVRKHKQYVTKWNKESEQQLDIFL